jgi:hypothetical protein
MRVISRSRVACPFLYSSLEDGVKSFMGTGPAAAAIANNDKLTVEQTIEKALQPFKITEDFYFLQNHFWFLLLKNFREDSKGSFTRASSGKHHDPRYNQAGIFFF